MWVWFNALFLSPPVEVAVTVIDEAQMIRGDERGGVGHMPY